MNSKVQSFSLFKVNQKQELKIKKDRQKRKRSSSAKRSSVLGLNSTLSKSKSLEKKHPKIKNKSLQIQGKSLKINKKDKENLMQRQNLLKITSEVKNKSLELGNLKKNKKQNWGTFMQKYRQQPEFGELVDSICMGYEIILSEFEQNKERSLKTQQKKRAIALNRLDLESVKKKNIPDYYDQFMSNVDNFSDSWTDLLKLQKRHD